MIKSHHCSYCPYKTTRMYNFKRHCRVVHNSIVETKHSGSRADCHVIFQCPNCQYVTKRVNDLKRHMKVMHNMKIKHPQNFISQISSENTNTQNLNKECHEESCEKRRPVVITSNGVEIFK